MKGELPKGTPHPAAFSAKDWLCEQNYNDLAMWMESFSSCAIEGNLLAEVCAETLRRFMNGERVSDRYALGLCWTMRYGTKNKKSIKKNLKSLKS